MTPRERTLVAATLAAALCGGTLWGYGRLDAARDAADVAARNLAECRRLAERLGPPAIDAIAADRGGNGPGVEVIRRIESSARAADVPETGIERIEPVASRRVAGRPLAEQATAVHLGGVTLRQVFTFLHAAGGGRGGMGLKEIRLSAPEVGGGVDQWSVEATMTRLVRVPQDGAANGED